MERIHAECPSRADVAAIVALNEQLEEDAQGLRAQLEVLRRPRYLRSVD